MRLGPFSWKRSKVEASYSTRDQVLNSDSDVQDFILLSFLLKLGGGGGGEEGKVKESGIGDPSYPTKMHKENYEHN